jgi:hypothetical protein
VTREHVFAEWIGIAFEGIIGDTGTGEIRSDDGRIDTYTRAPFTDKIKRFCEPCNSVWMSGMEGRVKPFLTPMMTGGFPKSLTPAMQLALANWAVKSALVLNYQRPQMRPVPDSEYPAFRSSVQPLPRQLVWIGHRDPRTDNLVVRSVIGKTPDPRDYSESNEGWGYLCTFSVGFVVLQVFGHNMPLTLNLEFADDHPRVMKQIWPVQGNVKWPSASIDTLASDFRIIHQMFTGSPLP